MTGFENAIVAGRAAALTPPAIEVRAGDDAKAYRDRSFDVRLPNGKPLVDAEHLTLSPGERVLVTGPSGAGKSTLFRAITGIWPFGSGRVDGAEGRQGDAAAAAAVFSRWRRSPPRSVIRPEAGTFDAAAPRRGDHRGRAAGLDPRIDDEAHWNRMLSLGEQQRLGIARALLQAPDYLFLDEATASLDEAAEAMLYRLLQERLKGTTIISIGHRSTLGAFHRRRVEVVPGEGASQVREVPLVFGGGVSPSVVITGERSEEIQSDRPHVDCFATEPVIGSRDFARARLAHRNGRRPTQTKTAGGVSATGRNSSNTLSRVYLRPLRLVAKDSLAI